MTKPTETEPAWQEDATAPGVWRPSQRGRSLEEERVLTEFARNYMLGRRWLCRLCHLCAWLGITIGALAAGWDHLTAGIERATNLLSRVPH